MNSSRLGNMNHYDLWRKLNRERELLDSNYVLIFSHMAVSLVKHTDF